MINWHPRWGEPDPEDQPTQRAQRRKGETIMNLVVNQAKAGAACKCGKPASLKVFVALDGESERDCCFTCAHGEVGRAMSQMALRRLAVERER